MSNGKVIFAMGVIQLGDGRTVAIMAGGLGAGSVFQKKVKSMSL